MIVAGAPGDGSPSGARSAISRRLSMAAWAVSVAVLALVALSALARTTIQLGTLAGDLAVPHGPIALGLTAAMLAGIGTLIALARFAAGRGRTRGPALPLLIVALAIAARLALALATDAPLNGENRIIHEQALAVLDGSCCFSHRPLGYPMALAASYSLLGVGPSAIEALNIAAAAVTAWLVWDIGRVTWGRQAAAMAATAYALLPSQVLMALVPLTEPIYTMLVAGIVRAAMAFERRPMLLASGVVALMLAASQYVRATAASLLAPIAVLPWLVGWPLRRSLVRASLIAAIFVVTMLPVVAHNLRTHGDLSLSTSSYGGWSMFVGVNREHGGQWNADDAARLAGFPGETWWARSEYAAGLVMDRVLEDPVGSLALLPRKFYALWGDESYAAQYALPSGTSTGEIHVVSLSSQLAWAPLTVLAALGMIAARHDQRAGPLLIGVIISLVVVTHLVLEVHSRYHASVVPLLCVLAAGGIEAVLERRRAARVSAA